MTERLHPILWEEDALILLDQTALPGKKSFLRCRRAEEVAEAIRILAVRGAPAIGVAAAYAMVLAVMEGKKKGLAGAALRSFLKGKGTMLASARPTAVNLFWAVSEMEKTADAAEGDILLALIARAKAIEEEDRHVCRAIGDHGADLFQGRKNLTLLTHCNAGALATAGIGTALGVIRVLHERGQVGRVYMDETRPLLQGARLTAFELMEDAVPCCLITDNMAASVMDGKKVDAVITGADRIAANGDSANKIGTYGLAVLAAYHHIPFYIAAPFSTFDFSTPTGKDIIIEERAPEEVRSFHGVPSAPPDVPVYNPAFDVTPASLISGIITEKGVLRAPYTSSISHYQKGLQSL